MIQEFKKFEFSRERGIVWVCDIANSSKYLNSNDSATSLEEFLPRLNWVGAIVVEAAGGRFIKWTGDGFLAWFKSPLHREINEIISNIFEAVWQLTVLINVTQLGVNSGEMFKVRHGVTYERDALVTKIKHSEDYSSLDLTGRAVILAFRLSGVDSKFPNVITERELVEAYHQTNRQIINFKKLEVSEDKKSKYFKNEEFGLDKLYTSTRKADNVETIENVVNKGKKALNQAENPSHSKFYNQFVENLSAGPSWCTSVLDEYTRFVEQDLKGTLEEVVEMLEKKID
ncbi:adenylate/guanylate cyclase domain-containing protein [Fodinibius halophilus]|uniref:Adenylate/guanylate cyclase domain-containing protein n=1 Tax=Fodinibius halophilus TaxID=1736908 RepID=A0A6M1T964_9BACT|nr:adenylate/guanylate cyclase domain-containing protein [Fodinibius halophilus]NGP87564.1 adenylate/guanylate cyclase domain-containing protein [Fodinibius halophilus]